MWQALTLIVNNNLLIGNLMAIFVDFFSFFFFFLAGHATAGGWPPQLPPRLPILSPSHPHASSFLLDLISPPPLRSSFRSPPLSRLPLRCSFCPLDVLHPGEMSCPLAFGVLGSLDDIPHFRS